MINRHRRWLLHRSSQHPFHRERRESPEIALYQVHLHTCHRASSLFAWPWSSLDHRSLARCSFILFLQLLSRTNSRQLSLHIMTPDFSRACHITLASVSTGLYEVGYSLFYYLLLVIEVVILRNCISWGEWIVLLKPCNVLMHAYTYNVVN